MGKRPPVDTAESGGERGDESCDEASLAARTLKVVGDSWTLMLVEEALAGTRRFGAFQKNLGVATNILSARLRVLVDHGILEMRACADRSDWREYHLTDKGRQLGPVIAAMRQWVGEHVARHS